MTVNLMYYDPNMHDSLQSQLTRRIKDLEAGRTMSMKAAKREDQVEIDDVESEDEEPVQVKTVVKKPVQVKKPATQNIVPEKKQIVDYLDNWKSTNTPFTGDAVARTKLNSDLKIYLNLGGDINDLARYNPNIPQSLKAQLKKKITNIR